jgi:hypothetical protein
MREHATDVFEIVGRASGESTRATFALGEEAHVAVAALAEDVGSAKIVFSFARWRANEIEGLLSGLPEAPAGQKTRKTYVVGESDLKALARISEQIGCGRDEGIERLVMQWHRIREEGRAKLLEKQRKVVALWREGVEVAAYDWEKTARKILPEDDAILQELGREVSWIEARGSEMESALKSGPILDD